MGQLQSFPLKSSTLLLLSLLVYPEKDMVLYCLCFIDSLKAVTIFISLIAEMCSSKVSPITIRAKVIGQKEVVAGNDNYGNPIRKIQYDIKQMKMFKGPQQEIKAIFTAPISPVCGVSLEREKEYLITGTVTPPDTIVRCASVPCAVNDPVECLWTDWITESTVAGPQTQHYTCIKRNDNSCAWYRGAAPPKTDFMDIEDP
uniref:TIMP metallopeptidase inhibitor 2b n=1 Tax=Astyanax mexicanus TaxID=7994 RepID=A0A8B9H4H3_ASTMX